MNSRTEHEIESRLLLQKHLVAGAATMYLLLPSAAWAGGVVTNCTETDLRAATAGGGTVTFACDGTITLASTITNTFDTVLDGSGRQITISGSNACRVFLVNSNVNLTLINLTMADGLATNGAGLLNAGGTVNITNCTFCGNCVVGTAGGSYQDITGESAGGGAVANQGVLNLVNCTFTNNSAVGGAGSIGSYYFGAIGPAGGRGAGGAVWNCGRMCSSGCTFAGNSAIGGTGGAGSSGEVEPWNNPGYPGGPGGDGAGGALFNCGTAYLVNCTLALNAGAGGAGGPGGPAYFYSPDYPPAPGGPNGGSGLGIGGLYDTSGQCHLTNCTIVFNSGTGIWTTGTNGTELINTLLAENSPGGNGSGAITDLGYNLSSDTTSGFTNTGSLNNTYPLLGSLTNNGGPTLTVALLPGCRAIDAGDTAAAPPTDQRGVPRPFGKAADIGAYEFNGATNSSPTTVVTECSEANLLAAMSGGGHVTFAGAGTIQLSNTVMVTRDTFLDAAGHQITLQGNGTGIFQVSLNVTFSLASLTVAGASIQIAGGFMNATNCLFSGNFAASGGAIQNENGGVCLSACVFTNNRAASGGALDNSGTLTADRCTFVANAAGGTDGSSGVGYGGPGDPGSDAAGGAIHNLGTLTVSRSSFTNNYVVAGAGGSGSGGIYGEPGMNGGDGGSGGAGGNAEGGALYNAGTALVVNSTFAFNSGTGGKGGAGGDGGPNYGGPGQGGNGGSGGAGGTGVGALFNVGNVQIINCTFASNPGSSSSGGAGGNGGSGNLGGSGGSGGNGGSGIGALYSSSSSCQITNCTFAGNSGTSGVGGSGGTAGQTSYPYSGYGGSNGLPGSAGSGTGGIMTSGALINTLLAANLPGGNSACALRDLGHNLSSDSTCAFTNVGSRNNTDPLLGPLANNGGPTLTMALLPGSPAIDAADTAAAPAIDQRGFPRPAGLAADIGAFEYGSVMPTVGISGSVANGLNILASGNAGQPCRLLSSTDLLNWVPIDTNQFGSDGTVLFNVNCPPGGACQFYRLAMP